MRRLCRCSPSEVCIPELYVVGQPLLLQPASRVSGPRHITYIRDVRFAFSRGLDLC